MLFQRFGKDMPAFAVRHEVERVRFFRVQHRLDRRAAGVGDRAGGQPCQGKGVVAVDRLDLRPPNQAAKRLAPGQAIDDVGVGLQPHALYQPVAVHARDHAQL